MALIVKDRVQEISTTVGTGTLTLGGAVLGFQSFAAIGDGNTTYYAINDPITGDWEAGIGTYTSSGTTLSRDTVLSSSNGGSLVSFAAGTKNVFCTYPSERAVYLDSAGSYPVQNTFNALTASSIALTTGTITTAPVSNTDIVNKQYADAIASGIHFHEAVALATTTALPANTYNNGTSGVGATLTGNANGALSVDSTLTIATERILVKNEAAGANNGVYVVTQVGSAGTPYILTRATDFDSVGTGVDEIDEGDFFLVTSGVANVNTAWVQQTAPPITIGTTAIVFQQFSAPITYTAGTGLNESPSYTFNIANTAVTPATYGTASSVGTFTVNAQGQITNAVNTSIAISSAAVSGLAASATTDTTNASNISSGTLGTSRLSGSYTGITGVGSLTAGTWNASTIAATRGGTGQTSYAIGDILFASTSTALSKLADVAVGNALISGGIGVAPSYGKIGLATHVSGTLPVANGGTGVTSSTGTGSVVLSTSPALVTPLLGTPTSGNLANCTFPTLNQNTTGTAAGLSATLVATSGGTGQSSYAVGDLLFASTTTALSKLADVATGNALISGGVGIAPAYGKIGLTTHVSGTLPVANGGTGITSFGAGVATWLGTPSSANLAAAVTDETGTGALVFATSPALTTPNLGTPASGNLANCTFPTLNQNTTGSAATLTTGRTISITGDLAYTSPSFDGSANVTAAGTLATVNTNVGSFTNASFTVNGKGLITAASSGTAPVTSVTGTSPVVSSGGATPAISLASGYGDTQNPYASKTANFFLAAPNGLAGVPTFRAVVAADIPTLNQSTTGNAATATALQTARTIGGVSFDGTANINLPGVNTTGNQDTTGNATTATTATTATNATNVALTTSTTSSAFKVPFASTTVSTTGNYGLLQDSTATFTYNPSTNTLTVGTVSATSFSGTATNATNVALTTSATSSAFKVPFANTTVSTTGNYGLLQDSTATFTYNPSTNTLTVGTVSAALSGNATTATTLQTARTIGGVSFNGSANIDLPGVNIAGNQNTTGSAATLTTARTLTIGSTGKTFNGSADVSWTLAEIGAAGIFGSGCVIENAQTITASYTMTSGSSGTSAGPITINSGFTVTIPSGSRWVVL